MGYIVTFFLSLCLDKIMKLVLFLFSSQSQSELVRYQVVLSNSGTAGLDQDTRPATTLRSSFWLSGSAFLFFRLNAHKISKKVELLINIISKVNSIDIYQTFTLIREYLCICLCMSV